MGAVLSVIAATAVQIHYMHVQLQNCTAYQCLQPVIKVAINSYGELTSRVQYKRTFIHLSF